MAGWVIFFTFCALIAGSRLKPGGSREVLTAVKKAGHNTEGGLRALAEGLEDSCRPCTTRLSVPGFFDALGPFPGSGWLFPEEKKGGILCAETSLLQPRDQKCKTVNHPCATHGTECWQCAPQGSGPTYKRCTGRAYTRVYRVGYIPRVYRSASYLAQQ